MADAWSYVRWLKECCSVIGRGTHAWVVYIGGAHGLGRFQIFAAYCSSLGLSILRHLLIVTVPDT